MSYCCYANDELTAEVSSEEWRHARKSYHCCECSSVISVCDEYQHVSMLEGGHWYTYKTCVPCADLREALQEVDCPYYEGLSECYSNWLTESPDAVMSVKPGSHAARLVPSYFIDMEDE